MNNDNVLLSDPIIKERATAQTDPIINYFMFIPEPLIVYGDRKKSIDEQKQN